ncbi:MAG: hypothetical protein GC186_15555 [Rhodobacteraceae bacterium]|nr:hypothetical protein [Paracoccaceae bacterium]
MNVDDPRVIDAARKANVQIVDISEVNARGATGHGRYAELAALYPKLTADAVRPESNLRDSGAFVFDTVSDTLTSPFDLAGKVFAAN